VFICTIQQEKAVGSAVYISVNKDFLDVIL